jgi:hypothetical protein
VRAPVDRRPEHRLTLSLFYIAKSGAKFGLCDDGAPLTNSSVDTRATSAVGGGGGIETPCSSTWPGDVLSGAGSRAAQLGGIATPVPNTGVYVAALPVDCGHLRESSEESLQRGEREAK